MTITWNPLDKGQRIVLSNGNLTSSVSSGWNSVRATLARSTGKYHFEVGFNSLSAYGSFVGIGNANMELGDGLNQRYVGQTSNSAGTEFSGAGSNSFASGSFTIVNAPNVGVGAGDRIMVAVDLDAGKVWLGRSGAWFGDPVNGVNPWATFTANTELFPAVSHYTSADVVTIYADQATLAFGPPSGYEAWGGNVPAPPPYPVSNQVIYANAASGNDANNGLTPETAVQTLQAAFDLATALDVPPPFEWLHVRSVGFRTGVRVQMAPAPPEVPYYLPVPLLYDCGKHPVYLIGDHDDPAAYNIYANNSLQGIAPMGPGHVICDGFTIRGDYGCTLINTLVGGMASVKNVRYGGATGVGGLGAAAHSIINVFGKQSFFGPEFAVPFAATESGEFNFVDGSEVHAENPMNFNQMFSLRHSEAWTHGASISWTGAWGASTGLKGVAVWYSIFAVNPGAGAVPGSVWSNDGTSIVV